MYVNYNSINWENPYRFAGICGALHYMYEGHVIVTVQNSRGVSERTLLYSHGLSTIHSRGTIIYTFATIKANSASPVIQCFEGIS